MCDRTLQSVYRSIKESQTASLGMNGALGLFLVTLIKYPNKSNLGRRGLV